VPPHILATPVAADLGDGVTTLLLPVSYFINSDSSEELEALAVEGLDARKYVAGGVVAVAQGRVVWHREFDVTVQEHGGMRAYMRTAPLPIDLDRDGKSEIIVRAPLACLPPSLTRSRRSPLTVGGCTC